MFVLTFVCYVSANNEQNRMKSGN